MQRPATVKTLGLWTSVLALAAATSLVAGCGEEESPVAPPPPPPAPPRAASIAISPSQATLVSLGETASFTASITDQYGQAYTGNPSWSTSDPAVFTVSASGVVTAAANGSGTVTASFEGLSATASVEVAQVVDSLTAVSGDGQRAGRGMALPEPVVVRAVDAGGSPVAGATVVFTPGEGHGTVEPGEAVTDTAGMAQTVWTLGAAEEQTLTAAVADGPSVHVMAALLKPDELVHTLEIVSGNGQKGEAGLALPEAVVVRAVDAGGSPVAGATVVFTPGEGHGTVEPGEAVTDTAGMAQTVWTLGAGEAQTLTAAVGDVSIPVTAVASNPDRAALEAFYYATGGPTWENNTNWLTDAPLGEWYGVTVDHYGRVTQLNSSFNGLNGRLPPEIGDLSAVTRLNVGYSQGLTGPIPPEIGNLPKIELITLNGNGLTGRIPSEIGNLSSLQHIGLGDNQLAGEIPPEIGSLPRLRGLGLRGNRLTGSPRACAPHTASPGPGREPVDGCHSAGTGATPRAAGPELGGERTDGPYSAGTGRSYELADAEFVGKLADRKPAPRAVSAEISPDTQRGRKHGHVRRRAERTDCPQSGCPPTR